MKYLLMACVLLIGVNKGTITCKIDGTQKSYSLAQSFFEISLGIDPSGPRDGLEILDGSGKKEGFQFEFKKSGVTKINSDATGDMNCIINYYNSAGITYTGEDVVVRVAHYAGNQLSGTFSGKLHNVMYRHNATAKNYPEYITITDGKFDLTR